MNKLKTTVCVIGFVYAAMVLFCFLKPTEEYSMSERRKLAQKPMFSVDALTNGNYTEQVENYVTDQFPFRDGLRRIKAFFSTNIMQKQDTNEIYEKNGFLCAMEYPMDEASVTRAAEVFRAIYEQQLKNTEVQAYFSVIPDKNYFLAEKSHLSMNYEAFFESIYEQTEFMMPIRIEDKLQITDYYKTDSHWKQEEITDVAAFLVKEMEEHSAFESENLEYTVIKADAPFYGVYYGQAALPAKPDELRYCTNKILEGYIFLSYKGD